jgi:hypothetical protein
VTDCCRTVTPATLQSVGRNRTAADRLLGVLVAALLLVAGWAGGVPRPVEASPGGSPAASGPPTARPASGAVHLQGPADLLLAAGAASGVPGSGSAGGGLAPGAGVHVPLPAAVAPRSLPPTARTGAAPAGAPGSRAPPAPAGT